MFKLWEKFFFNEKEKWTYNINTPTVCPCTAISIPTPQTTEKIK